MNNAQHIFSLISFFSENDDLSTEPLYVDRYSDEAYY
jgi:hypothetical protein